MELISFTALKPCTEYYNKGIKLRVCHFCPLDGSETEANCKRVVIASDATHELNASERYLVVLLYGTYAKTPFKKSSLKVGQTLTLERFATSYLGKKKVFKCDNGVVITNFYDAVVVVKSEHNPIIKMLVTVRESKTSRNEDTNIESTRRDAETPPLSLDSEVTPKLIDKVMPQTLADINDNEMSSPAVKRLRFDETMDTELNTDAPIDETHISSADARDDRKHKTADRISVSVNASHRRTADTSASESRNIAQKYVHKTLLEVHNLQPVSGRTYVNIYGVLIKTDQNGLSIYLGDETLYSVSVKLRAADRRDANQRNYLPFKTGDIIRIHRLLLAPNTLDRICIDPKDMIVFKAFEDMEMFTPNTCAINYTIEDYDRRRMRELEEWFADKLMNKSLSKLNLDGYVDIAAQVLSVQTSLKRSLLYVWDATCPALRTCNRVRCFDTDNGANSDLLEIVNRNEMGVYITVYDEHSIDATKLKPMDIVVIFNASIKEDQRMLGYSNITLNSTYKFGKCIRLVTPNSYLGKRLLIRIEEYKVISAVNTSEENRFANDFGQFQSQSQPIISEQETHDLFDDMSSIDLEPVINTESVLKLLETQESLPESYLPEVIIVDIPEKAVLFKTISEEKCDRKLYSVQARVFTLIAFEDVKDLLCLLCTNANCHQIITFKSAFLEDSDIENKILSSADKEKHRFHCSRCETDSAKLYFRLCLILEDTTKNKFTAELRGHDAELVFSATPVQVLLISEKADYVKRVLSVICAKSYLSVSRHSANLLLNWVIETVKTSAISENYTYVIRTVTEIEKWDKCVGLNHLNSIDE